MNHKKNYIILLLLIVFILLSYFIFRLNEKNLTTKEKHSSKENSSHNKEKTKNTTFAEIKHILLEDTNQGEKTKFPDIEGFKNLGGGGYNYCENQKNTSFKKEEKTNQQMIVTVIGFLKSGKGRDGETLILKTGEEYITAVFSIPNLDNIKSEADIPDFDYKIGDKLKITVDWFYFYGIKHCVVRYFSKIN